MPFSPHGSCSPVQRFSQCIVLIGASITGLKPDSAHASKPVEFQSTFMRQMDTHDIDAGALALKTLSNSLHLTPGRYRVSIDINQTFFDSQEIDFAANQPGDELTPCLPQKLLNDMGVKLDSLEQSDVALETCVDIQRLIPGATVQMDSAKLTLSISIPQIAMRRDIAGYVDPQRWDYGINSAFVNYQLSAQQGRNDRTGQDNSHNLYLNSGLNLGVWRLRSNNTFRSDATGGRAWSRAYTYLQRDLASVHSQLTLGETFTPGDVFRSVPIRGVQIASDMSMLPDSQQRYAPIIRGVAQTRAKLEIRQNGFPIYSTYVSAGPYEINDLTLASGSGELEIILTEADGQVRRFTQPYATLTHLLREGVWRYSASMGRYNAPFYATDDSMLWQGTLAMGTRWDSTVYGGLMGNDFYQATTVGLGKGLGVLGALSFDLTRSYAQTNPDNSQHNVQGMSYAVKYGKSFETRTNLRFAGYRYSTEGYRDFNEAVRERSADQRFRGSRRSMLEASVFQDIGLYSSLNLIFSQESYWQQDDAQRQFQFSFSSRFNTVNYSLYASQSLNDDEFNERQFGLNISVPLNFGRSTTATYDVRQNRGQLNHRASVSGRAKNSLLNYRASVTHNETGQQSAELSLGYQAPFASLGAGLTQGTDFNTLSLNASGALLLHADGLETGPYLGETSGLIHVPNIANVGQLNDSSARTNDRGYALIPYLQPFRINRVILDTAQLDPNVEIDNGVTQVVPRRGAVVKASFPARKVERILVSTRDHHGVALPFGAQISNADGLVLGIVGQAGQALLSTDEGQQIIYVRWGKTSAEQCQAQFDTHSMPLEQGYRVQDLVCR